MVDGKKLKKKLILIFKKYGLSHGDANISSNAITSTMSVTGTISETDPNALPLALALG